MILTDRDRISPMEALTELCDIIAANPGQFADKLAWICSRCPPQGSLLGSRVPPRASRPQLHALLAIARFLSRCPAAETDSHPAAASAAAAARSIVVEFLRSAPSAALRPSFWPQSFPSESVSLFFVDFLRYVSIAAEISPKFNSELEKFSGGTVISAAEASGTGSVISRLFLIAASEHCPPIQTADAEKLLEILLDQFCGSVEIEDALSTSSSDYSGWNSSAQSTPSKVKIKEDKDIADDGDSEALSKINGSAASRNNSVDQLSGSNEIVGSTAVKHHVLAFEEEPIDGLDKQAIAFKIFSHILDKGAAVHTSYLEQVRKVSSRQLKFLPIFLKVRKPFSFYALIIMKKL